MEATTLIESQSAVHVHVEILSPSITVIIRSVFISELWSLLLPLVILLDFPVTMFFYPFALEFNY